MTSFEDTNTELRDALNARVAEAFERLWPTIHRELSRMARARWDVAAIGKAPQRKWKILTTPRLLEAPGPTMVERALGIASAVMHVEAQCRVRGAIEAWTVTMRAYPDHDEAQVVGANSDITRELSPHSVRRLLRLAELAGPGRYPLTGALPPPPGPSHERPQDPSSGPDNPA